MKKQIRFGVYETNSSSVHTLTILNDDEYKKFMEDTENPNKYWNGEKYIDLVKEYDRRYANNLFRAFDPKEMESITSDDDKIRFMLNAFDYRENYEECASVVEEEVMGADGNKLHIISRYSWD